MGRAWWALLVASLVFALVCAAYAETEDDDPPWIDGPERPTTYEAP